MSDNLKNDLESPDDQQRRADGKAGKLWSIVVIARHGMYGQETKRFARCNLYGKEVQEVRRGMFQYGILLPVDPQHWIIIHPQDILQIDIEKQKYFSENDGTFR